MSGQGAWPDPTQWPPKLYICRDKNNQDLLEIRVDTNEGTGEPDYLAHRTLRKETGHDMIFYCGARTNLNKALATVRFHPWGLEITYYRGKDGTPTVRSERVIHRTLFKGRSSMTGVFDPTAGATDGNLGGRALCWKKTRRDVLIPSAWNKKLVRADDNALVAKYHCLDQIESDRFGRVDFLVDTSSRRFIEQVLVTSLALVISERISSEKPARETAKMAIITTCVVLACLVEAVGELSAAAGAF